MIIKTAIALILTASLAGGAVYFGTQDETGKTGEISLGDHPHKQVDRTETSEVDEVPLESEEQTSSGSVIDRLINRKDEESKPKSTAEKDQIKDVPIENELETTEVETEQRLETIDVQGDIRANNGPALEKNNFSELNDKDDLVDRVLHEIQKIESVELKDQAYFDVVLYTIEMKMFAHTSDAISNIQNPEYRDSARGEYAMALIEDGQVDAALEILDSVETEKLRDVLRLKAVKAMVDPQAEK